MPLNEPSEGADRRVLLRAYLHGYEAVLARGALASAGIEATILDGNIVDVNWLYSDAVGGVKLLVRQADLAIARELLSIAALEDRVESEGTEASDAGEACPRCGSRDIEYRKLAKRLGGLSMLLGIPLPVRRNRDRCRACGRTWRRRRPSPRVP